MMMISDVIDWFMWLDLLTDLCVCYSVKETFFGNLQGHSMSMAGETKNTLKNVK